MDTAISINGFYRNTGVNSKSHNPIRLHGPWPICRAVVWHKNPEFLHFRNNGHRRVTWRNRAPTALTAYTVVKRGVSLTRADCKKPGFPAGVAGDIRLPRMYRVSWIILRRLQRER